MEHGAAWITYRPDLPQDQVEELTELVESTLYGLSALPEQESPIVLTAWGRQLEAESTDDGNVERFFRTYADGRQSPEKGATCAGNSQTGRRRSCRRPGANSPTHARRAAPAPARRRGNPARPDLLAGPAVRPGAGRPGGGRWR